MMMLAPIAPRPNYTFFEFYIILFCMLTKFHGISREKKSDELISLSPFPISISDRFRFRRSDSPNLGFKKHA